MKHSRRTIVSLVTIALIAVLSSAVGCTPAETPLPAVEGVQVALGPAAPQGSTAANTVVVSWNPSTDGRVQGYAIYRAEQGIGASAAEKSEFVLQAVTVATEYVDDEVHTTVRYPTVRYFYQVAVVGAESAQGPMSPEVSIDYTTTG